MTTITVRHLHDFLATYDRCTIACVQTGVVVRTLVREAGDKVRIIPGEGEELVLPGVTPLLFEAWVFDRGSILFRHGGLLPAESGDFAKMCGEGDVCTYPDGTRMGVTPSPFCEAYPHTVVIRSAFPF